MVQIPRASFHLGPQLCDDWHDEAARWLSVERPKLGLETIVCQDASRIRLGKALRKRLVIGVRGALTVMRRLLVSRPEPIRAPIRAQQVSTEMPEGHVHWLAMAEGPPPRRERFGLLSRNLTEDGQIRFVRPFGPGRRIMSS